jgi:serine/threonine-protein kinase
MSPEQVRGGTVDGRTDIYSFGVTLYEMLTGRKPFQADTSYSVLNAQLNEAPTPPVQWNNALSPELNDIVLRAMAKDPANRFQSAEEFRNALKSVRERKAGGAQSFAPAPVPVAVPPSYAQVTQPVSTGPQAFQQTVLESRPIPTSTPGQGFTPVPAPALAPPPQAGKSHRGLWIGLGALAAVLAIVAAASVLPRFFPTHAGQKSGSSSGATQTASTTPPASNPAAPTEPVAQPPDAAPPANPPSPVVSPSPVTSNPAPRSTTTAVNNSAPQTKPVHQTAVAAPMPEPVHNEPPAPAGPTPEEIRHSRDRFMDLDARAETVRGGVEQLRRQQQAQGFDMRGDVLGEMNRMNSALREADRSINEHDLQAAREYMDKANEELHKLESFLGR